MANASSNVTALATPSPHGASVLVVSMLDSPIGELHLVLGPSPSSSQAVLSAVDEKVSALAAKAFKAISSAMAANQNICMRCARVIMRAAMGSAEDQAKVNAPSTPAENGRIRLAWGMLSRDAMALKDAMARLNALLQGGSLTHTGQVWPSRAEVRQVEMTGGAALEHFERSGAPMNVGRWREFKACACGSPDSGESPQTMVGSVPALPPATHTGCGCGCNGAPGGCKGGK